MSGSFQVDSTSGGVGQIAGTVDLGNLNGAALAAKQPNFGTAGTPSADVVTTQFKAGGVAFVVEGKVGGQPLVADVSASAIQGGTLGAVPPTGANNIMIGVLDSSGNVGRPALNAAGSLIVSDSMTQAPITPATATATKSSLLGGVFTTALPVFTNNQQGAIPCDQNGAINAGFDGFTSAQIDVTSAVPIFTADTTGYESIEIQVLSAGTSCTVTYKSSLNNTNFTQISGVPSVFGGGVDMMTTSTAAGIYAFPCIGKQFRAEVTTYGSGTVSVIYMLRKKPWALPPGLVAAQGRGASGTTANTPPFPIAVDGRTSNLTVTNGQQVYAVATLNGVPIVRPWSIPEMEFQTSAGASGVVSSTAAQTIKAAGAAGVRIYLKSLEIATDTLSAATEIVIRDGSVGTIIWRSKLQTTALPLTRVNFEPPLAGTAATLMEWALLTSVTGGVYVNCHGFQAA